MNLPAKKVLIITYYWPPAGGPGVQRWLKFVKYLPAFQVQPIVYIPSNPTYPIIDKNLLNAVASDTIILKHTIVEPYGFASLFSKSKTKNISSGIIPNLKKQSVFVQFLLWIRGNIFIPDARFLWVNPSVRYLKKYIIEHQIETIITSGPPHSLHLIGLKLQQSLPLKWVADFRDPWTTIGYHKELKLSNYAQKKHKALEKKVLNAANQIIVTSKTTKTEFQAITNKPIAVITNGFDLESTENQPLDAKFSVAHIGSFLSERNPKSLWQALSELCNELENFKNDLQIKIIGASSEIVLQTLSDFNLSANVLNLGYLPHDQAVEHQQKSQVLLLIEIDSPNTKSIIPGKLFEYMVSTRPILAIGPNESDFAEIIQKTQTGTFFEYHQKQQIKEKLTEYYKLYRTQNLKVQPVHLEQYARKNLTYELSKLL